MMKKHFIVLILILFFSKISISQVVTGKVYSNDREGKKPLPGVNIFWDGTQSGTSSDQEGNFSLNKHPEVKNLVFSFVGYSRQIVLVTRPDRLEVVLQPDLSIQEITVVEKNRGTYMSAINPISTVNITSAELCKAACCNLAESFETNPSVDVNYSDAVSGAKQIRLLGLVGTYTSLQVENIPNLRGLAANFGISYVPGPWMESIQVSKGAASVVNGFESIAGQINVEYKKPDSADKLNLNLFTSNEGMIEFNAHSNIRVLKDKITTGLLVHTGNFSNRIDHNHDGFMDQPLSRQLHLTNRWKFNFHTGLFIQVGMNLLLEDRLGGQSLFEKEMPHILTGPYGISIKTNRSESYLKVGYLWPDQHTAIAFLSNYAFHKTNSFYGITDYEAKESRIYSNLVFTKDLNTNGTHLLNAGISFISDDFNEMLYQKNILRAEKIPGLFGEYTFKPGENLTFMAGLRTDFHNSFGTLITPRMHFRFKTGTNLTFRISAGKGFRSAGVISENTFLLAGYRPLKWTKDAVLEEAWNFGAGILQHYTLFGRDFQINTEFFRTDFQNQLVADRESSDEFILLSPLSGKSYANSFQADIAFQPVERFDLKLAYRINDVWQTIGGKLLEAPLTSRYKGLITMNYFTNLKKWMFDYTVQFNGGGRISRTFGAWRSLSYLSDDYFEFKPFTIMNAQVTRFFRFGSIYAGAENFTDFRQKHPVENFENPYNQGFDATNVWGPVMGRRIHIGLRFALKYN